MIPDSAGNLRMNDQVFTSSKFKSLVREATIFFHKTPLHDFPPNCKFPGSGVYALYYVGEFCEYSPIVERNKKITAVPIYVGKTVPEGWRTARITNPTGRTLSKRLQEHANNIDKTNNLLRKDFKCRYMVFGIDEMELIGTVEAHLIRYYRPLWNTVIGGFGNHDPGSGRYDQAKSDWDVIHPGRDWADKLRGRAPYLDDIVERVRRHLTGS